MLGVIITVGIILLVVAGVGGFVFSQYRKFLREAKNYERGLKMLPLYIHIPPISSYISVNFLYYLDLLLRVGGVGFSPS